MTHFVLRAYCGLNGPKGAQGEEDREAIVAELCRQFFPNGVTTYDAVGLWAGYGEERTVVVELITTAEDLTRDRDLIRRLAAAYKMEGEQEAVMLACQPIDAELI